MVAVDERASAVPAVVAVVAGEVVSAVVLGALAAPLAAIVAALSGLRRKIAKKPNCLNRLAKALMWTSCCGLDCSRTPKSSSTRSKIRCMCLFRGSSK